MHSDEHEALMKKGLRRNPLPEGHFSPDEHEALMKKGLRRLDFVHYDVADRRTRSPDEEGIKTPKGGDVRRSLPDEHEALMKKGLRPY